ncbi:MAG: serine hydrolase domain-containing protein [Bacteroidales bacterium]
MKYKLFFVILLSSTFAICQSDKKDDLKYSDEEKLAYFLELTDSLREKGNNTGMAIAIIYNNKLIYKNSFGYRNVEEKLPVTNNTLFEIASCTKAFTGMIASRLVKQKKLNWNDKVVKYLPDFTLKDKYAAQNATLLDLLTHRVGVGQHYYMIYGPDFDISELLERVKHLSFDGSFREKFLYNNFMYAVAGLVEEKAAGKSWNELIRTEIFEPIGMNNSYTRFDEFMKNKEYTLSYSNNGVTRIPQKGNDTYAPAGSITSSINDMAKWLKMLVNSGTINKNEFISKKEFEYLTSPLTVRYASSKVFYGIGWEVDLENGTIYHDGRNPGQSSRIQFNSEKGFGIVILTNQETDLQTLLVLYAINIFLKDDFNRMPELDKIIEKRANPEAAAKEIKRYSILSETKELINDIEGTYNHPAYGNLRLYFENSNELIFKYYDFIGTSKYNSNMSFTAFTNHYKGDYKFNFEVEKDKNGKINSVKVPIPYTKPLHFKKVFKK